MNLSKLVRVNPYEWRIEAHGAMRVPGIIFADQGLIEAMDDKVYEQVRNVAALPGIVKASYAMPDAHWGYGFPIGGVAATDWETGVVSPGGVGFDINCGVRLARTSLGVGEARARMRDLINQVFRDVPCGAGGEGPITLGEQDMEGVLLGGSRWAVEHGYGEQADVEFAEQSGALAEADPGKVSARARQRGRAQLGTIGSGNHFLEIQYVEQIHDREAARALGIETDQVVILIHTGSRGLGHQVCTGYLAQMGDAMKRYGITVPDRQLACVPVQSPEGQAYLGAMRAPANFAWANRQAILHFLRGAFRRIFGPEVRLDLLYDVCHNIAKRERHTVGGASLDVLVHRKGATRAFPPGHPELPAAYRAIGQPVLIPGSMGTASWILVGAEGAMRETFGSVCHGAGRLLSRTAAKKGRDAREVQRRLEEQGIVVRSETRNGILEEIPEAYKNVDEVIEVAHGAGLARKVARLRPIGVIKG